MASESVSRKEFQIEDYEVILEEYLEEDEESPSYRALVEMSKDDFLDRLEEGTGLDVYAQTEEWEKQWSTDVESLLNDGRYSTITKIETDYMTWRDDPQLEIGMGPELYDAVLESLD